MRKSLLIVLALFIVMSLSRNLPTVQATTSNQLPALTGNVWAAEINDPETGNQMIYIVNQPTTSFTVKGYYFKLATNQLVENWSETYSTITNGFTIPGEESTITFITNQSHLIVNSDTSRLKKMPGSGESSITIPSYDLPSGTEGIPPFKGCCYLCCLTHCILGLQCQLDYLCCNKSCGGACFCAFGGCPCTVRPCG